MISVWPRCCAAFGAVFVGAILLAGGTPLSASAAQLPDCNDGEKCGLMADGPYGSYVIGMLTHIGSDDDLRRVFRWAKQNGYWKLLPNNEESYIRRVKLVTIKYPGPISPLEATVFMERSEFESAPYELGDFVRYTPHDGTHDTPPDDREAYILFHGLTGCVAVLCTKGDAACSARYQAGLFSKDTGQQIDPLTGQQKRQGIDIDPISLLPDTHFRR